MDACFQGIIERTTHRHRQMPLRVGLSVNFYRSLFSIQIESIVNFFAFTLRNNEPNESSLKHNIRYHDHCMHKDIDLPNNGSGSDSKWNFMEFHVVYSSIPSKDDVANVMRTRRDGSISGGTQSNSDICAQIVCCIIYYSVYHKLSLVTANEMNL